jgi:serine/threonine protein phosphatase PrpC
MEDAHISSTDVARINESIDGDSISVFGVFDGHGGVICLTKMLHPDNSLLGKEVSKFCQLYFIRELIKIDDFKARNFGDALKKCFHTMDEMLEDPV